MGFFNLRPDDAATPMVWGGDDEDSFIVPASGTVLGGAHKAVLKSLGDVKLQPGEGSKRFVVVIQRIGVGAGVFRLTFDGKMLGTIDSISGDGDGHDLIQSAMSQFKTKVIKAEAYVYRRREGGAYGVRVFLPEG